jgi:hypothetical protein
MMRLAGHQDVLQNEWIHSSWLIDAYLPKRLDTWSIKTMKLALSWIADQRIEAAQQRGEFRNLPGEGRPLVFDEDSSLSFESRLMIRSALARKGKESNDRNHFLESIQLLRAKRAKR